MAYVEGEKERKETVTLAQNEKAIHFRTFVSSPTFNYFGIFNFLLRLRKMP
jgi:hypothetical protein